MYDHSEKEATESVEEADSREQTDSVVLRKNIVSDGETQKICKLLIRNFGAEMEPLIRACIDGQTHFVYQRGGDDIVVEIGETKLWALYSKDQHNELLCALIWRFVHGQTVQVNADKLMFEILFLATSEHA